MEGTVFWDCVSTSTVYLFCVPFLCTFTVHLYYVPSLCIFSVYCVWMCHSLDVSPMVPLL